MLCVFCMCESSTCTPCFESAVRMHSSTSSQKTYFAKFHFFMSMQKICFWTSSELVNVKSVTCLHSYEMEWCFQQACCMFVLLLLWLDGNRPHIAWVSFIWFLYLRLVHAFALLFLLPQQCTHKFHPGLLFFLKRCLLLQHFLHSKFICQIFRQHTSCFHRWPFSKCFPSVHSNQIQHNAENYHHCTTSEQTDSFTSRATFQKYVARDIHERYPNLHAPIARAIHYVARDVMYTKYQYYRR